MSQDSDKKSPGRSRYHHGDLRRTLLKIAREQIAEGGAQTMSLASLARLAGVSQPAPYRHFADRKALLEAVTAEGFDEFAAALAAAAESHEGGGALKAMALAYVEFGEANIELYRLMFASRLVPDAAPGSDLETAAVASFHRLRDALSAGEHMDGDAHLIWAQLHGLVMLKADGQLSRPLAELVETSRWFKQDGRST